MDSCRGFTNCAGQRMLSFFRSPRSPADGVLVVGYGNPLRGDDGAGPNLVRMLEDRGLGGRRGVFLTCHHPLPEHAAEVARYRLTIFVDASVIDAPGDVVLEEIPGTDSGVRGERGDHHVATAHDIVRDARRLYGACGRVFLCRIGGHAFDFSEHLSPEVQDALEAAERKIRVLIEQYAG